MDTDGRKWAGMDAEGRGTGMRKWHRSQIRASGVCRSVGGRRPGVGGCEGGEVRGWWTWVLGLGGLNGGCKKASGAWTDGQEAGGGGNGHWSGDGVTSEARQGHRCHDPGLNKHVRPQPMGPQNTSALWMSENRRVGRSRMRWMDPMSCRSAENGFDGFQLLHELRICEVQVERERELRARRPPR